MVKLVIFSIFRPRFLIDLKSILADRSRYGKRLKQTAGSFWLASYYALKEKATNAGEIKKAFPGYEVVYGVFSKSGFTQRMIDTARENPGLLLINEDGLM